MTTRSPGSHADRTIIIEGPFQTHGGKPPSPPPPKWARATVETQEVTHRVAVVIPDELDRSVVGSGKDPGPTANELEEARALLAIIELAQRSTDDFKRPQPDLLPEIQARMVMGPDSGPGYRGMWSVPSLKEHECLRGYTVRREGSKWIATPTRYFPATVMGGRLHVDGATEGRPWDSGRLDWWREDQLDLILAKGEYGEKVRTLEELETALRAPMKVAPTRRIWLHESLEDGARQLWKRARAEKA